MNSYLEVKQKFLLVEVSVDVKWELVPFYRGTEAVGTEMEAGKCYTLRNFAYFATAPYGWYHATLRFIDEFGEVVNCSKFSVFLRK